LISLIVIPVLVVTIAPEKAYAGAAGGGATEWTQIANNVLLGAIEALEIKQLASIISLEVKEYVLDPIAYFASQAILEGTIANTIGTIQNLDGAPAFVQNLETHLLDLEDLVATDFASEINILSGTPDSVCDLGSFAPASYCDDLARTVSLSTASNYENRFASQQNSLSKTVPSGNIDDFRNDFSQGGWEALISLTADSNTYSQSLFALDENERRIALAKEREEQELLWGRGARSKKDCDPNDPLSCLVQTPAAVLEEQLNEGLSSAYRGLENADEIDELLSNLIRNFLRDALVDLL